VGIAQVIGVAGGEAKAEAILGALRGGHVSVLVTDDAAARKLLALDRAAGE
jgi:deoxyribonucleoside regulator